MRPTVHDIAEKAGVSLATVDRVLNNRPGVRAKTRALVEETIVRIGYVRDVAAANLARKRLYRFEFLIPDSDNSFLDQLRVAVSDVAALSRIERIEIGMREVAAFDPAALVAAIREAMPVSRTALPWSLSTTMLCAPSWLKPMPLGLPSLPSFPICRVRRECIMPALTTLRLAALQQA